MTLLIILCICGPGLALVLAAFLIRNRAVARNEACSARTTGEVVGHRFPGNQRMTPVVRFEAGGQAYTTEKKFNGVISTRRMPSTGQSAYEDDKGYLHVEWGAALSAKELAESLWPIGSAADVHYDPSNPNANYVDRPTTNSFLVKAFAISGVCLIVLGLLMAVVVRQ